MGHELDFVFGERNKTPILLPGFIIDLAQTTALGAHVFHISSSNGDEIPPLKSGRQTAQTRGGIGRFRKPPRIKVFDLFESARLKQRCVIRGIV